MELRHIVWHWPLLVDRLRSHDHVVWRALARSCRPLAAERSAEGVLSLVIASWFRPDFLLLSEGQQSSLVGRSFGRLLEEQIRVTVVPWPAGWGSGSDAEEVIAVPDLLAGLGESERTQAGACETPIQRYFYAHACRQGLRPICQLAVGNYRLDFAFEQQRVAAEIAGWSWHRSGASAGIPRERKERLGVENWQVRWFSGQEVVEDVARCVSVVERLLAGTQVLGTRRYRRATPSVGRELRKPSTRSHSHPEDGWSGRGGSADRRRKR